MTLKELWTWAQEHEAEEATVMVYRDGWVPLQLTSTNYDEFSKEFYL